MCYRVNSDNSAASPVWRITARRPGPTRSKPSSSSSAPSSTTTRACCCCRRRTSSRTASPTRAATGQAPDDPFPAHVFLAFDDRTSTSTWARTRRSIVSTTSTATISTTAAWASPRAQISVQHGRPAGRADRRRRGHEPAARRAAMGRGLSRLPGEILHPSCLHRGADEDLPYPHQTIDLDPNVRDAWGLPAPRMTTIGGGRNELKRAEFMLKKITELGRAMGRRSVAGTRGPRRSRRASRGRHAMGSDPKTSVVNRYGPELGHSEPVHHRLIDLPVAEQLQSDADDPGARLYERRCDRKSLLEESRAAAVAARRARPDSRTPFALFQWLNAHHPAVMVGVPDRHRIGRVVDPGLPVVTIRLRQHVLRPMLGFRIEAKVAAGMQLTGPDLAIPVDVGGCRQKRKASAAGIRRSASRWCRTSPARRHGRRTSSFPAGRTRRAPDRNWGWWSGSKDFAGLAVRHHHAVARPGAAAKVSSVLAHRAAVGGPELLSGNVWTAASRRASTLVTAPSRHFQMKPSGSTA